MSSLREFVGDQAYRAAVELLEALTRERDRVCGLEVDVPSKAIRDRILEQAEKHDKLAALHELKRKEIEQDPTKGLDGFDADELVNAGVSNEQKQHRAKAKTARTKASWCRFVAEHLVVGATYRLDSEDLRRIGFYEEPF